jgi:transcriptional antiterminator RfaH
MLPPEPNVYPSNLFEDDAGNVRENRSWWVLHTMPRQEKALARQLLDARVPFYLPLLTRKNVIRGRLVDTHLPLFTSYLFLLGDGQERLSALTTKRVVRTIEVRGQQELWADLTQVHRLITSGLPVSPEDRLYPGASVVIRTGALAGLRGTIIREAGRRRFVVQVDFIQKGASVILDDFTLAAVKE